MFKTGPNTPDAHDPLVEDRLQFGRGGREHRAIDAVEHRLAKLGDVLHRMIRFAFGATDRTENLAPSAETITHIAARSARIAFGLVLTAGAAVLALVMLVWPERGEAPIHASTILAITWFAATVAWRATRSASIRIAARRPSCPSFTAGYALPSIGLLLVIPLSWFLPMMVLVGAGGVDFDRLAYGNVTVVGGAYVCSAAMAWLRAVRLRRRRFPPPVVAIAIAAVLGSLVPDFSFDGPQEAVVFLTLVCMPFVYIVDSTARREREVLGI